LLSLLTCLLVSAESAAPQYLCHVSVAPQLISLCTRCNASYGTPSNLQRPQHYTCITLHCNAHAQEPSTTFLLLLLLMVVLWLLTWLLVSTERAAPQDLRHISVAPQLISLCVTTGQVGGHKQHRSIMHAHARSHGPFVAQVSTKACGHISTEVVFGVRLLHALVLPAIY
jgi:hypothetical protein